MDKLQETREQKDAFFTTHPYSPLTDEQKKDFKGLAYFPEAPELRFEVQVEAFPNPENIDIQTSTGETQTFQRYGKFSFRVGGQEQDLTIFSNQNGLFLPFVDSLAGQETYPAGRYLEPIPQSNGSFIIDFNQAYNPYCAYNDIWICPLTPSENRLDIPIQAGEKIFKKDHD